MDVVLIDHYDSFTHNVIDWLRGTDGAINVRYVACDDEAALRALAAAPLPLVVSPGPKRPEDAASTLALLRRALGRVPILGICLGHQMLALLGSAQVVRAKAPLHGSTRFIEVPGTARGLLRGLAPGFHAAVYNSLTVAPGTLQAPWAVDGVCSQGDIQAISYAGPVPAYGLQFHPESFLSEGAAQIRGNWLALTQAWRS